MTYIPENHKFLPYEDSFLNDSVLKVAKDELGESPEVRAICLRVLKQQIAESKNLRCRLDDGFLLRYLRTSKFDSQKAYERIRNYYKQKKSYPEISNKLYPSTTAVLRSHHKSHFILPYRHFDNTAIIVNKRGLIDPRIMTIEDYYTIDLMLMEVILENPVTQICGLTAIMDLKGLSLRVLAFTSPKLVKCFYDTFKNCLPIRIKSVHVINVPMVFNIVYSVIYPFIPDKLRKRLVIHPNNDNWKSLHSCIPPEVLPEEYGGKLGPLDYTYFQNLLKEREDTFKDHLNYGYTD